MKMHVHSYGGSACMLAYGVNAVVCNDVNKVT